MTTNVYKPGVCNIGRAEIRRRQVLGVVATVVTVALFVVIVVFDLAWGLRLLIFVPSFLAVFGFLQASQEFCARFGLTGFSNFDELGSEIETLHEPEFRAKDRRKAIRILVWAAVVALVVLLVTLFV